MATAQRKSAPGGLGSSSGAGHPANTRSACDRCREQKLRCIRFQHSPQSCERCLRSRATCFTSNTRRLGRPRVAAAAANASDAGARVAAIANHCELGSSSGVENTAVAAPVERRNSCPPQTITSGLQRQYATLGQQPTFSPIPVPASAEPESIGWSMNVSSAEHCGPFSGFAIDGLPLATPGVEAWTEPRGLDMADSALGMHMQGEPWMDPQLVGGQEAVSGTQGPVLQGIMTGTTQQQERKEEHEEEQEQWQQKQPLQKMQYSPSEMPKNVTNQLGVARSDFETSKVTQPSGSSESMLGLARVNENLARQLAGLRKCPWRDSMVERFPATYERWNHGENAVTQVLQTTSEFLDILHCMPVHSPAPASCATDSATTASMWTHSVSVPSTSATLLILSAYLQLIQLYDLIFKHIYSAVADELMRRSHCRTLSVHQESVSHLYLYGHILLQTAKPHLENLDQLLGMPASFRLMTRSGTMSHTAIGQGLFNPSRSTFTAGLLQVIMRRVDPVSQLSGRALVSSLRDSIQRACTLFQSGPRFGLEAASTSVATGTSE